MDVFQAMPRNGRPPKVDAAGVGTRERLLAAAVASCVEYGFDGATVADIAQRSGVSAPALYHHFGGKVELMVAAGRAALFRLTEPNNGARPSAGVVVHAYISPSFAPTRRLLTELHLAAQRHAEVAALLAEWHTEQAAIWRSATHPDPDAAVKTFFALLLGMAQIDSLAALPATAAEVTTCAAALADLLYPDEVTS